MTRALVGALACAAVSLSAHAEFNPGDSVFGANTLIYDSSTSLTWLSTTASKGLSYNQVTESLSAGETFAGYRIATQTEVTALVTSLGIPAQWSPAGTYETQSPEVLAAAREFIDLFGGATFSNGTSGALRGAFDCGPAFYAPEDGPSITSPWLRFMSVGLELDRVNFVDDYFGRWKPNEYADMGTFMVAVPEPSTYALMLVGLGALALMVRRRSNSQ